MINEILRINDKESTIQLSNNIIKAIRKKDIIKVAIRIYHNGIIGVAGQYGEENIEKLFARAEENLKLNIKYPCEVSKNIKIKVESEVINKSINNMIEEVKELVKELDNTGFIASGNIKVSNIKTNIINEENLYCYVRNEKIEIKLTLKEKGSKNIFDVSYILKGENLIKMLF